MTLWAIRRTVLRDSEEQRAAEDDSKLEVKKETPRYHVAMTLLASVCPLPKLDAHSARLKCMTFSVLSFLKTRNMNQLSGRVSASCPLCLTYSNPAL
jgi:hypothetical protein